MDELFLMENYVKKWKSKIKSSSTEVEGRQVRHLNDDDDSNRPLEKVYQFILSGVPRNNIGEFETKWNELKNENEEPTLVLSVIGDSNTPLPNQWRKDVFQTALIETAKSEKETWILYRGSTDEVSQVVEKAYQNYENTEFRRETRRIKLISRTAKQGKKSSTDVRKIFQNMEDDPSFLDFETFVSKQSIFYTGSYTQFEITVPTVIIVCEGDIHTISHISKALKNQLPVIIMKGSGKAADLVLNYLDKCDQFVIKKKFRLLFGDEFDEEEYKKMKEHLKYIKHNRELIGVFDLHKDDPMKLSGIVGEAVVSLLPKKNNGQINLEDALQSEGHMHVRHLKMNSYVMNPSFSTSTSLPLYFCLEYKVLKESEVFMKKYGKVLLLEALKANRCEYVSSLMDHGVAIESSDLPDLYKWQSKKDKTLVELFFNMKYEEIKSIPFEHAMRKACRMFLQYTDFEPKEKQIDISDVLLWAIIFNRRELAEMCWLRGNDHLLTGIVCSAILKRFAKKLRDIEEDVLADDLEEHSKIFEQRYTRILNNMSYEDTNDAIEPLIKNASVWGIHSSPLIFAYENSMYDVVVHTCSKKYVNRKVLKVEPLEGESEEEIDVAVNRRRTNRLNYIMLAFKNMYHSPTILYKLNFINYGVALILYSLFVLTSTSTDYYVQGRIRIMEYYIYLWRVGDFFEEILQFKKNIADTGCSKLNRKLRAKKYFNNFWNMLDLLANGTLVLALFLRQLSQSEGQMYARNMFALSLLFMYLRFLEAFLIWKNTGTTVIMIKEMLKDAVKKYIIIVLFLLCGVGIYYHANLWPDHQTMWSGSWSNLRIWTIFSQPFWQIFGEVDLETLTGSDQDNCSSNRSIWEADPSTERCPQQDWTVPVIAGIYMMFTNVLLVNIVIANFSAVFQRIDTNSEKIWYFHLYMVMMDYSGRLPSPFNLLIYPLLFLRTIIRTRSSNTPKVSDSIEITKKKTKEYQHTLQKTVALGKHRKATAMTTTVDTQLNASN